MTHLYASIIKYYKYHQTYTVSCSKDNTAIRRDFNISCFFFLFQQFLFYLYDTTIFNFFHIIGFIIAYIFRFFIIALFRWWFIVIAYFNNLEIITFIVQFIINSTNKTKISTSIRALNFSTIAKRPNNIDILLQ